MRRTLGHFSSRMWRHFIAQLAQDQWSTFLLSLEATTQLVQATPINTLGLLEYKYHIIITMAVSLFRPALRRACALFRAASSSADMSPEERSPSVGARLSPFHLAIPGVSLVTLNKLLWFITKAFGTPG